MNRLRWSLCLLALAACESVTTREAPTFFSAGSAERLVSPVEYDTLWTYGGFRDTLLVAPNVLLAKPDGVYVLDVGSQQVMKFTNDGLVAWVWGERGEGPGEVQRVRAMSATADGVVIADSDNQRLLWVDSTGTFLREGRIRGGPEEWVGSIEGMATLESGYVLESTTALWPILLPTGAWQSSARSPWPAMGDMHALQRIGMVIGTEHDQWVFSFLYGNGWIKFDGDTPVAAHPFVEHSEFPRVIVQQSREGLFVHTSTRHEARPRRMTFDVKAIADTVMILSADIRGRRLVDKYDINSGEYQHSQPLPVSASKIDFAGDLVFVIDNTGLAPTIRAFRATMTGEEVR